MSAQAERSDYCLAYGLFLFASVWYFWGIAPTIYWRDAPEFITAAHLLGITHPAGSPTYTLLAKLLTFLPLGNIALRVNLFSALAGAVTVSLLFMILSTCLASAPAWIRLGAALSGALFLLVSESFWRFSAVAEVYTLQNALLMVLIWLLLKARAVQTTLEPHSERWYWLFAFVYGLSAGVHATMALFAPAFLIFIGWTTPPMFWGKRLAFLAFFFLFCLSVYLYLPLRSLSDPALDWGDTETWQQFVIHVTDRKDAAVHFDLPGPRLPGQIRLYLSHLINEFSIVGGLLGVIGFGTLMRRDKPLTVLLGLAFLGHVGFFLRSWTSAFGFLPSFVILAIWIGFGVYACLVLLNTLPQWCPIRLSRLIPSTCVLGGLVLVLGLNGLRHAPVVLQSENYSAEIYGKHLLEQLPPEAILFSSYAWFPLLYLQQVEHRRPDLSVLLQSEVFYPSRFAFLSQKRLPNVTLVTSDRPVQMSSIEYFWELCRLNSHAHALFWEPDGQFQQLIEAYLRPEGFLFAFTPWQDVELTADVWHRHTALLTQATERILHPIPPDTEGQELLAEKVNFLGLYFQRRGLYPEAAMTYQVGLLLSPDRFDLHTNYGGLLGMQQHFAEALRHLQVAYRQDPANVITIKNLGLLYLSWGKNLEAVEFLERARALGPSQWDTLTLLGEAYIRVGRFPEAMQTLRAAVAQYDTMGFQQPIPEALSTVGVWGQETLRALSQGQTSDLLPHPFFRSMDSVTY
jgi:tetratricopeptide (TPR) repeat protein